MKKIILLAAMAAALSGCKNTKALLPNVSGKAGEVLVVMEKADWEGAPGSAARELLASDCSYLAQAEPLYSLANVPHGSFADLFKVHRNIVIFNIGKDRGEQSVEYLKDIWAHPQCVILLKASCADSASAVLLRESERILATLEQAERDRVIANSRKYEEQAVGAAVRDVFGEAPHFPFGYKLKKNTGSFIWIADEKQYSIQGVFVYSFPVTGKGDFELDRLIAERNSVLKENVPGMFEGTYMTTGTVVPPTLEFIKYQGRSFAQMRGYWEVENDYMGGPFVSQFFYSQDGSRIIALEAFVYAPKFDKRQYLRQVESILYSWD